jgi:hypothetical protein
MSFCIRRTIPVVLASAVLVVAGASPGRACDEPRSRHCVAPSGDDDDTRLLQAELDRCAGARRPCTVSLCAGIFPTTILRVRDFRGTLRGAGPEKTILRALPDLPTSQTPGDFYREDPFIEARDPWPYLVQFVEGKARILDLAIEIPAPDEGSSPTTGWNWFGFTFTALKGGLLLTGRDPVDFTVRHVRVEAGVYEDSTEGATAAAQLGASCEGLLFDQDAERQYPIDYPVFPVRGACRITDSVFRGVLRGTSIAETSGAKVLLAGNDYVTSMAVDVADADRSHVAIVANRWDVDTRGVQVQQNLDGPPSQESAIEVSGNHGRVVPKLPYSLGDGLFFLDPFEPSYDPGGTTLRVTRNRWTFGDPIQPATEGLRVVGAARLRILDNVLNGRVVNGVTIDHTTGCRVARNVFGWEKEAEGRDLRFMPDASGCLAVVGPEDSVADQGPDNQILQK